MSVSIASCGAADIDEVVRFIDAHWERGHVLVTHRRLLDWQYRNADGSYSFVVARSGGEIVGLLGFIATRRYDAALARDNVVWLTTWKVRADANIAGLGVALLQHLTRAEPHVAIGAIGLNPATRSMYAALGYRVGELDHFVASIAGENGTAALAHADVEDADALDRLRLPAAAGVVPRKTPRYFHARYVAHPFYRYRVVALQDGSETVGLIASRVAAHDDWRALRIVDFAGSADALARAGAVVQSLIRDAGAAYADLYATGIDPDALACAGFRRVDPDGNEIVPDHFEPFEPRNVRLLFAVRSDAGLVLLKGDGDQDRPNRLPESAR